MAARPSPKPGRASGTGSCGCSTATSRNTRAACLAGSSRGAPRKLLVKKKQRDGLLGAVSKDGVSLVPLDIHFNERGLAKVLLGLGQGKQKQDKRQAAAAKDWARDKARLMRDKG